jgi:hypothetical protein
MTSSHHWLRPTLLAGLACAALSLSPAPSTAADPVVIYRPHARTAAELAPVARTLLAPGGAAIADPGGRGLVLRGSPEGVARTLEVLRQLDVRPVSYRIESLVTRTAELEQLGLGVEGWLELGALRVGRMPATGEPDLGLRAQLGESSRDRRSEAMLTVLEGHEAELWTGTLEVEPTRRLRAGPRGLHVRESTTWVPVRSGFRVTPRGLADGQVELEIEPVVSERRPDGAIERTGAASRVRVRPGETLVLADVTQDDQAASLDPLAADHTSTRSNTALLIRVTTAE